MGKLYCWSILVVIRKSYECAVLYITMIVSEQLMLYPIPTSFVIFMARTSLDVSSLCRNKFVFIYSWVTITRVLRDHASPTPLENGKTPVIRSAIDRALQWPMRIPLGARDERDRQ